MTDKELVTLLKQDQERGMEKIIEQHTGLLWTVASQYLSVPEDVKDCVNDTFVEFFYNCERFDSEKGSLKGYLAAITKHLAVRRYWENRQNETAEYKQVDQAEDPFSYLEQQEELNAALKSLDPLDEKIIRLKYYGGMTAEEIAASLGLPYETVKKRHQRSLKKLYKALTIGLVVALLAALLAACAYVVLRYFGIVPGYGVNIDPESAVYVLETSENVETENYDLTVTDAWWNDGVLIVDAEVRYTEDALAPITVPGLEGTETMLLPTRPALQLKGLDDMKPVDVHVRSDGTMQDSMRLITVGFLPEQTKHELEITLLCDETERTLTLNRAERELTLDEAGYYSVTEENGGLLAIPRLENGELIVSIYPLDVGKYRTGVGLTMGICSEFGGPSAPVTAAASDGTILIGRPVRYSPFSGDAYLDWNFGPAESGTYTLTVPYLYQTLAEPGPEWTQKILLADSTTDQKLQIQVPDAEVLLGKLSPAQPMEKVASGETILLFPEELYSAHSWWTLDTEWNTHDPQRVLAAVPLSITTNETEGDAPSADISLRSEQIEAEDGSCYYGPSDYVICAIDSSQAVNLRLDPANLCYRWNCEFQIPFEVSE